MSGLLPTVDLGALLLRAAQGTSLICVLRGLPFVVYACSRGRRERSAWWLLAYGGAAVLAFALRPDATLLWCLLGWLYYLAFGCLMPTFARLLRARHVTAGALFALFALSLLLLPGALAPEVAATTFLVLGWELMLAGYSYCHDSARRPTDAGLADCLFFLFVDPTLTYAKRSRPVSARGAPPSPAPEASSRDWFRGLRRTLLGLSSLFLAQALLQPAYRAIGALDGLSPSAPLSLAAAIAFAVMRFSAEYAAHSGLASMQIGLMQRCGYATPERYRLPFLARDPIDFWRRWNTYVAGWLRQYVFLPTARRLKASALSGPSLALAVIVTVIASGLLHDGYGFAGDRVVHTRALEFFLANGVAILAWAAAGRLTRRAREARRRSTVGGATSRVLFAAGMLCACLYWG